ncbi:DNA endonuclease SmrA [Alteromonas confluentis]|uniref:DNA mismatch repair protein MutS n=1 Tax=Alteromonas confluentis TaxID=1656094 RepID=A0A1E7Z6G9_9ALTE|nr:DNA endonuclease SmrA [Alteromonas confluentis]OFC68984.1 DNA mismatch repair protein MutS [Alteromonas confluentis]
MDHHFEDDDLRSFMEEMGDVKPITSDDKVFNHDSQDSLAKKARRAALAQENPEIFNPLSMENVKPIKPDDFIAYQQPGIQDGVFKNLRLGKYDIEQRVSLKNLTLKECRDLLYQKLKKAHERGSRALLIQHGKGENSQPIPALKKSYVNHWLRELDWVIAWHTAQPMHGGFGATYVLLKKHPQQKLINREKNRKK